MSQTIERTAPSKAPTGQRWRFALLGLESWRGHFDETDVRVCADQATIFQTLEQSRRNIVWICAGPAQAAELMRSISLWLESYGGARHSFGNLLILKATKRISFLPVLAGCFERVVGGVPGFVFLPPDQLAEVLTAPPETARDLFIGGMVDEPGGLLLLVRANLDPLPVPLTLFRPSGRSRPDFGRLSLDDYGQTIRFGDYEATADLILYEFDPDYRRRLAARRRAEEQGFGPALRRLRSQRGLSRTDFPGVSAKTIARIERGEVDAPHGRTLTLIARRLGVKPAEIETY